MISSFRWIFQIISTHSHTKSVRYVFWEEDFLSVLSNFLSIISLNIIELKCRSRLIFKLPIQGNDEVTFQELMYVNKNYCLAFPKLDYTPICVYVRLDQHYSYMIAIINIVLFVDKYVVAPIRIKWDNFQNKGYNIILLLFSLLIHLRVTVLRKNIVSRYGFVKKRILACKKNKNNKKFGLV